MVFTQNGETYAIVYNGELYNTEELRQELQSLGHRFEGYSDTEVLLHSFVQWKEGCLEKLNGIYAFAVWDAARERLVLARDRMGVKPLFYTLLPNGGLLFASEIKGLLAHPDVRPQVDAQGVGELLLLGPGRTPGCGVFRGICELRPGEQAVFDRAGLHKRRYWQLKPETHCESEADTCAHVRTLVKDAIRRQLVSDVPLGAFLSGGLDSSLLCAVAAPVLREQGRELVTFSVDYRENERYFMPGKFQPSGDNPYIARMTKALGCPHRAGDGGYRRIAAAVLSGRAPGGDGCVVRRVRRRDFWRLSLVPGPIGPAGKRIPLGPVHRAAGVVFDRGVGRPSGRRRRLCGGSLAGDAGRHGERSE